MPFERELEGRVAVITGAGRSIGRAMAIELANAGCNVVVNVRSNRAEGEEVVNAVEKAGGRGMVGVADVIDPKAVNAMVDAALQKFGRIDYLVNNAALRQEKSIEHLTFEDWRKVIGITLDGAFHCVKACLESIKKSDAGSIINVGASYAFGHNDSGVVGASDLGRFTTSLAGIDATLRWRPLRRSIYHSFLGRGEVVQGALEPSRVFNLPG